MAKMTRNDLKGLVKECLFEILLEATEDNKSAQMNEGRRKSRSSSKQRSRRPALDNIVMENKKQTPKSSPKVDVSELTTDPVMAAIFQDTAKTTLVEQAAAERRPGAQAGGDAASRIVAQNDPSELFGDASRNWAALAFND